MAVLDEKRERFANAFLANLAAGMARGKAAAAAARAAGYKGSSLADNARRLPRHPAIKARLAELAAPAQQQRAEATLATLEMAHEKLSQIILANIDISGVKAPDVIAAVRQVALMFGWNAPENINVIKHDSTDWSTDELVAFIVDARRSLQRGGEADQGEDEPDRIH